MTVAELITQLTALDQSALVYVRGYEGGVNDVSAIRAQYIQRNYHDPGAWYYGRHKAEIDPGEGRTIGYELCDSNTDD